jgi:predicted transcriptional regulator
VTGNRIRLLAWLVDRYDTEEQPVTPAEAANRFDSDIRTVDDALDSLESQCLLATVGSGYRPTVTARELLELDVDDDTFLVLDTGPENDECAER